MASVQTERLIKERITVRAGDGRLFSNSSLSFLNASLLLVGSFGGRTTQPLIFNRPETIWLHRKIAGDKEVDKLFLFNLSSLVKGYFLL
jgi:hypothetical protein